MITDKSLFYSLFKAEQDKYLKDVLSSVGVKNLIYSREFLMDTLYNYFTENDSNKENFLRVIKSNNPKLHKEFITFIVSRIGDSINDREVGSEIQSNIFEKLKGSILKESSLEITINPGTAPQEELVELLMMISRMYRKLGGKGITFSYDSVIVNQFAEYE